MTQTRIKKGVTVWSKYTKPTKPGMPTLVFIHGWVQNHTVWKHVITHLAPLGYGFMVIDLPGHGLSSTPKETSVFEIAQLTKICSKLIATTIGTDDLVLVGHSMGGMIGQLLGPQLKPKAIVLADTTYTNPLIDSHIHNGVHVPFVAALMMALAKQVRPTQKSRKKLFDFTSDSAREDVLVWLEGAGATNARALLECLHSIVHFNSERVLVRIKCPVLLLVGSDDERTPLARMKQMSKLISNSKLVCIKNSGHNSHLSAPDIFANHIHTFLEKQRYYYK